MKHSILVIAVLAAGCTPMTPAASSSAVLIPERTWVIVAKPLRPTAFDVVRIFQQRGYHLADLQSNERGMTMRFKGERKIVSERIVTAVDVLVAVANATEAIDAASKGKVPEHQHPSEPTIETYELGSVYYVRVEPRGETMTSISAIGRPTRNGFEACTPDPGLYAPCVPLAAGPSVQDDIAGFAEADMINGVFAELRLEGLVVAPDVQLADANHQCWQRRRRVEAAANRVSNPQAKKAIMGTAPVCESLAAR